jgi:hypothetical protein
MTTVNADDFVQRAVKSQKGALGGGRVRSSPGVAGGRVVVHRGARVEEVVQSLTRVEGEIVDVQGDVAHQTSLGGQARDSHVGAGG